MLSWQREYQCRTFHGVLQGVDSIVALFQYKNFFEVDGWLDILLTVLLPEWFSVLFLVQYSTCSKLGGGTDLFRGLDWVATKEDRDAMDNLEGKGICSGDM